MARLTIIEDEVDEKKVINEATRNGIDALKTTQIDIPTEEGRQNEENAAIRAETRKLDWINKFAVYSFILVSVIILLVALILLISSLASSATSDAGSTYVTVSPTTRAPPMNNNNNNSSSGFKEEAKNVFEAGAGFVKSVFSKLRSLFTSKQ